MKFGLNYNLYNSSYHIKKSALYSYKANNYLNNCGHNIKEIVLTPRFIGLATCALLLVAASFLPFFHSPILGYFATNTIALISGDPAFIFTGALFSSGHYYSLLDKARIFGATIMLMDNSRWGMKIAKCFVENIKNLCAYTSYQLLSWGEYFKSGLSDFFKIDEANDEVLDIIPEEEIFIPQNAAEKIFMHQQYISLCREGLTQVMKGSSKAITWEGSKLLGITAGTSSVLLIADLMRPLVVIDGLQMTFVLSELCDKPMGHQRDLVITRSAPGAIKLIGLLASISPFLSTDYVQRYCNGDLFSLKSINYHLLQYAKKEIYNEFINQLGTGVILSLGHSALIAYHAAALYKAKWDQAYEKSVKSNLDDSTTQENLGDVSEVALVDTYDNDVCVTSGEATEEIID